MHIWAEMKAIELIRYPQTFIDGANSDSFEHSALSLRLLHILHEQLSEHKPLLPHLHLFRWKLQAEMLQIIVMVIVKAGQIIIQMERREETPRFKVLLIGPSGVGKTSLLLKYVQNRFSYDYQVTSGIEFYTKEVAVNERNSVNLQIWDTMGQEAYKSVVKSHYKGVAAVIFFYSLEKMESFERLALWVKEVREHVHEEAVYYLVGTKLDLEDVRKVTKEMGESYCKAIKASFFLEISSKTGENVKELFDKIAKHLFKKYQSSRSFKELVKPVGSGFAKTESFRLRRDDGLKGVEKKKSGCC